MANEKTQKDLAAAAKILWPNKQFPNPEASQGLGSPDIFNPDDPSITNPQSLLPAEVEPSDAQVVKTKLADKITFVPDPKVFQGDLLQIGDIFFGLPETTPPPSIIHISQSMVNHKWQTLRTTEPTTIASGYGNEMISLSLYFVGLGQINSGLRRLLATFNAVPFVYIENDFIRSTLSADSPETMAVTLVSLAIRTEQEMPNVLVADLELSFFNYKPYSSHFWFRRKYDNILQAPLNVMTTYEQAATEAVEGVRVPSEAQIEEDHPPVKNDPGVSYTAPVLRPQDSEPLVQVVDLSLGPQILALSNRITLGYRTYKIITSTPQNPIISSTLNTDLLRDVDQSLVGLGNDQVVLKLNPKLAEALEAAAEEVLTYTQQHGRRRRKLIATSCFRTRQKQLELQREVPHEAAEYSWHECGLAIDISQTGWTRTEWSEIVRIMGKHGLTNYGVRLGYTPYWLSTDLNARSVGGNHVPRDAKGYRLDHETWHWEISALQNQVLKQYGGVRKTAILTYAGILNFTKSGTGKQEDLVDENGNPTTVEEIVKKKSQSDKAIANLITADLAAGWNVENFATNSSRLILYKEDFFEISDRDPNMIPQGLVVAKRNIIAEIPIQGYGHSTQQYMGAGGTDAVISFFVLGTDSLKVLNKIIDTINNNARSAREIRDAAVLSIDNCICNFAGLNEVLVEDIETQTVSGQPDLYSVTLRLTATKRKRPRSLAQDFTAPTNAWRKVAEAIYKKFFSVGADTIKTIRWLGLYGAMSEDSISPDRERAEMVQRARLWMVMSNNTISLDSTVNRPAPYEGITNRREKLTVCELFAPSMQIYLYDRPMLKSIKTTSDDQPGGFWDLYLSEIKETTITSILYEYGKILAEIIHHPLATSTLYKLGMGAFTDLFQNPNLFNAETDSILFGATNLTEEDKRYQAYKTRLVMVWQQLLRDGLYLMQPFTYIYNDIKTLVESQSHGSPCYPDLTILPHPLTGDVLDSAPDFWFWNETLDGDKLANAMNVETDIKRANAVLDASYSSLQARMGAQAYDTEYVSPNKGEINEKVRGQPTGKEGKKAKPTKAQLATAMLHETALALPQPPIDSKTIEQALTKAKNPNNINLTNSTIKIDGRITEIKFGAFYNGELIDDKIKKDQSEAVKTGLHQRLQEAVKVGYRNMANDINRLSKAFPTFKIYFIEEDETEQGRLGLRNFDDLYSYSAVKDIRYVDSHQMPASLCVISIVNINGELDTLQFTSENAEASNRVVEKFDPSKIDTKLENPFSKLVVMEGSKIQVRLGYSNDPNDLETVFNGQVVEVATSPLSNDIIQLVCQSYGVELVAEPKVGGSYDDTQELLCSMICSPELEHFGRWTPNARFDPASVRTSYSEDNRAGALYLASAWNKFRRGMLMSNVSLNTPQDDNIFAPSLQSYTTDADGVLDVLDVGFIGQLAEAMSLIEDDRVYTPYQSTVWDIFKEMELRHPGFVTAIRPYGTRCTLFFGPPEHGYWYRPLTQFEIGGFTLLDKLKQDISAIRINMARVGDADFYHTMLKTRKQFQALLKWLLIGRSQRYKPFRDHFMLSSLHNIIANNIYASAHGTYNAVDLLYADDQITKILVDKKSISSAIRIDEQKIADAAMKKAKHFVMKADDNIRDRETRVMAATYLGCQGDFFARRYAVSLLMRSLRDVYKGEITILGDPRIRPYDVCMIYDHYRDMYGPVEVGQVTHILSQETGFITQIKPDLIVSYDAATTMSTLDALLNLSSTLYVGMLGGGALSTGLIGKGIVTGIMGGGFAAAWGGIALGIALTGGYKLMQWSQSRQPILYTPVCQGGKPLIAGMDGYKRDTLLVNLFGRWERSKSEVGEGFKDFWQRNPFATILKETGTVILQ